MAGKTVSKYAQRFKTTEQRFWEKVDITPGCWVWLAKRTLGYGSFWNGQSHEGAHRYSYRLHVGPIPPGFELDHLCRNRACVNPAHLEPVTQRVNLLRGEGACARNARKKSCLRGHEFTESNTRILIGGRRECRICRREIKRRYLDRFVMSGGRDA